MPVLEAGTPAPEFRLRRSDGSKFTHEDLLGRTTVLVFYPYAFSEVCSSQFSIYNELLDEFTARDATLYGVSTDATPSQEAFRRELGVDIEMLSDFEPKGAVSSAFGVLHKAGMPTRALVIVGPDGVIAWSWEGEHPGVLPGANLIFDGLEAVTAST